MGSAERIFGEEHRGFCRSPWKRVDVMDAEKARHQRYQSDDQLNTETLAQRIRIPVRDYRPEFLDHFFFIGIAIETGLERGL